MLSTGIKREDGALLSEYFLKPYLHDLQLLLIKHRSWDSIFVSNEKALCRMYAENSIEVHLSCLGILGLAQI